MNGNKDLFNRILNVDYIIAGGAFVCLVLITFVGIIMRYAFRQPFSWLEEVQLLCFVWMAFTGGCIVFRQGSHICIDVLVDMLPPWSVRIVEWGVTFVNIGALCYLCLKGSRYVMQMHESARVTNILGIPYAFIYIILPIGCTFMILNQIVTLFAGKGVNKI